MMMTIQSYILYVVVYSGLILLHIIVVVHGQSTFDFQGPGYFTCPAIDYESQPCDTLDIDPTICSLEALQSCNFSGEIKTSFDDSLTTIIIPLVCECIVAIGCPGSCSFTPGSGAIPGGSGGIDDDDDDESSPTSPTPTMVVVVNESNYTGIGTVTCPYVDYFPTSTGTCRPTIQNNDLSLCGTCDPTILDPNFSYIVGDTTITISLPCTCVHMYNCPNTCTYTTGLITIAPTPAVTTEDNNPEDTINDMTTTTTTPSPIIQTQPTDTPALSFQMTPSTNNDISNNNNNNNNAPSTTSSSGYNNDHSCWYHIILTTTTTLIVISTHLML